MTSNGEFSSLGSKTTKDDRPLRVLFAPETFNLGETSRAVEVAREVAELGHDVHFMGYSHRFADYVRDAGFSIDLLEPELTDAEADQLLAVDQGRSIRHPFTTAMVRQRVASELALIERWRPDVVVIGTTLTLYITARAARVPLIYVQPHAMSSGYLVSLERLHILDGRTKLGDAVNRSAARVARTIAPRIRWRPASFRRVAREHHVSLPKRTFQLLDADLNLISSLFPYIDNKPLAAHELAVGSIFARDGGGLPGDVVALADKDRPVIYVGLGSSGGRSLALRILEQVAELDVEVVTSTGRYLGASDLRKLPSNVYVYDLLPAHLLAGLIDASVIHGGEGTVQTACVSGVPFAGIGLQTEQRFNIDECVRYGNALSFTARDIRKRRLPSIVGRLLTDASLRRSAAELQPLAQPVGAVNAARAIVEYVNARA